MFTRKFIDRLKDKYQKGGLRNPMLSIQSKTLHPSGKDPRVGLGAKLSGPIFEAVDHGKHTTGLRFETDFTGTNSGPISVSDRIKAYNAAIGLRGYHNRFLDKRNKLALKTNLGAGIGTGDEQGDTVMNPYADINLSLIKSKTTRKGRTISGGPTLSYGTEGSPTAGLRTGLTGSYGRLSGNVDYDIINKTPRTGVSLNFQEGGVSNIMTPIAKIVGKQGVKHTLQNVLPRFSSAIGLGSGALAAGTLGYETFKRYGDELSNMGENTSREGGGAITVGDLASHSGLQGMGSMKQTGGTRLPGGQMQQIPGSDAVEFSGQTHDQGGIMLDPKTEVENGETMDQVTMAQKGGKRDYFFSSHLKNGGRSYADMHKDILEDGGEQEEINMLAKMQEAAAGRNPQQVAKLGGIAKYQTGGEDDQLITPIPSISAKETWDAYYKDYQDKNPMEPINPSMTYEEVAAAIAEQKAQKELAASQQELFDKAEKKGEKGRGVPIEAKIGMGIQAIPSIYALLHKQKPAEQAGYTPGFTSPVVAGRVKASKLERVNYNDKRSALTSGIRGMNKFIETSGGGPANMANLQATLAKEIGGQMKIDAAETQANIAISNKEKQLSQQAALDNAKRSQASSQFNAQMIRAEAAREDQIEGINAAARQKLKEDREQNVMNALISGTQGVAGVLGDTMTYKANERMAKVMGAEGIYERDIMRNFVKKRASKDGIPDICLAGECTEKQINDFVAGKFGKEKKKKVK